MKINFSLRNHLQHKSFAYLIAILVTSLILCYSITLKVKPSPVEVYSIFLGMSADNVNPFKNYVADHINPNVKEIHTFQFNPNSPAYNQGYEVYGFNYVDILIVQANKVLDQDMTYFVPICKEFQSENDYIYNNFHYGYMIYDGEKGKLTDLLPYVKGEKYFLFVAHASVHLNHFVDGYDSDCTYTLLEAIYNG